MKKNHFFFWVLTVTAALFSPVRAESAIESENVTARLVASVAAVAPGQTFWVGLHLKHAPHWHTYWENPADSGLPTTIDWTLPTGFVAGAILWPYPESMALGPLISYGFERPATLLVPITAPDDLTPGATVKLRAKVDWLECKEICLPGGGQATLTLHAVATEAASEARTNADLFDQAFRELPQENARWQWAAWHTETGYRVAVTPPDPAAPIAGAHLFLRDAELVRYDRDQQWRLAGERYVLDLERDPVFGKKATELRGVLVGDTATTFDGYRALSVNVSVQDTDPLLSLARTGAHAEGGLLLALLLAFAGGLILNLMPCVFPVISMKIMGFVQQAEQEKSLVFKHGLIFSLGIMVSFWILAALLIGLRAGGEQLGWGFQMQSPVFLLAISILFFLFALNLFGVFEVGTSWMGLGQKASASGGWTGSFFSGALATLIATPCTAPGMGAALGYAITLSPLEAMLIFTMLGLGMALPYALLSAFPQWLRRLPKPGAWMESFKQVLGWIFILVVLYMAKVLQAMAGGPAVMLLLYVLCVVGMAAWILGRWGALHRTEKVRYTGRAVATFLLVASTWGGISVARQLAPSTGADQGSAGGGIPWETFTPERLATLRAEGKPVFINFTAAWCTMCQVNEITTFSSARLIDAFAERGIVPLKADWTHRDNVIGEALAGYGRNSVPFYVFYDAGEENPVFLPEVLRPGIVLSIIDSVKNTEKNNHQ